LGVIAAGAIDGSLHQTAVHCAPLVSCTLSATVHSTEFSVIDTHQDAHGTIDVRDNVGQLCADIVPKLALNRDNTANVYGVLSAISAILTAMDSCHCRRLGVVRIMPGRGGDHCNELNR
jgi:hypothetical protein